MNVFQHIHRDVYSVIIGILVLAGLIALMLYIAIPCNFRLYAIRELHPMSVHFLAEIWLNKQIRGALFIPLTMLEKIRQAGSQWL
jgi:hypothetical protein